MTERDDQHEQEAVEIEAAFDALPDVVDAGADDGTVTYEFAHPPPRPRRRAMATLGEEMIARLLRLPPGWEVISVRDDWRRNGVSVMVTGPDAPECAEGAEAYELPIRWAYNPPPPEVLAKNPTAAGTLTLILPDYTDPHHAP